MLHLENHDHESAESIRAMQSELFLKHWQYTISNSPFYQKKLDELGIALDAIKSLDDLTKIPTTSKDELAANNGDFVCVDSTKIIEYVTTSGTLGEPVTIALTQSDLDRLAYNEARSLGIAGISPVDTIQITTTLDKRFMAGMAYYLGATKLGAAVVRAGIGDLDFQADSIRRFKPTTMIAVPSFAIKLGEYLMQQKEHFDSIRKIICIGETIREDDLTENVLCAKNKSLWNAQMHGTYASTEMATAFTECEMGEGGHLLPELIIVEILDESDEPVKAGELGEVTVTPLGITGMPLLRYKTGDLARMQDEPCACGRKTPRLGPIVGRKNQMIKYKGTTLYPQQIERVMQSRSDIDAYLITLKSDENQQDRLVISVSDELSTNQLSSLSNELKTKLRVSPEIITLALTDIVHTIRINSTRKPKIFFDERNTPT